MGGETWTGSVEMKDIFSQYYQTNFWRDDESVSGHGSSLEQTESIRAILPGLFRELGVKTLLDIPCGDFNWFSRMKEIENIFYIGADIVPELIYANRERYVHPKLVFQIMDVTCDRLPIVDLVFCRDLLGHFSNVDVRKALVNIKASRAKYLLATTFPDRDPNADIETGQWRPIDLAALRYGLGPTSALINENCTAADGDFADKTLGLWRLP